MKVLKGLLERQKKIDAEIEELRSALVVEGQDEPRSMTDEEQRKSLKLLKDADEIDSEIKREVKREKRNQRTSEARELVTRSASAPSEVAVLDEPMVYGGTAEGVGSEYSYFADLVRYTMGPMIGGIDPGVAERFATWSHQVEREVANDTKRGREARKMILGQRGVRSENGMESRRILKEVEERGRAALDAKVQEFRDGTTGMETRSGITTGGGATASASGGGAAAFVIPVFYEGDYAPWREAGRCFADRCNKRPLPDYGMTVYLPAVQGPAQMAQQGVEGGGIAETDPTAGFLSGGVITTAGQVTVTQQLLDRAGPNVSFDQILFDQLNRDYNPKWDAYVIAQAIANAGSVAFTGSWAFAAAPGTASFVSKLAGAINAVETTAGTVMSPSDLFLQTTRWNFMESVGALESSSGSLHPLIVPMNNGPFNAFATGNQDGYVPYEGSTGYKLLGLPISKDLNIPAPGTGADQAIVGNMQEVYVYEGPLVPRVVPQTLAPNLAVFLQLYSYGTVIVRYQKAIQVISGTGMATITF